MAVNDVRSWAVGVESAADGPTRFVERERALGAVGDRDLLVRVQAVSVNPVDTKLARKADAFRVLGLDAVGVVVQTGALVEHFHTGDRGCPITRI
ncbi:hypothetical protein QBC39DRAFT_375136 [Podospora conica]|nr:hypothetical protein QBC39DRAFT_375136 [Schizothecium conicum]